MDSVKGAIEEITYKSERFPAEAFKVITTNKTEAIPCLREALKRAIAEKDELDENYQLHFYALFLLGEFQDKESFPLIMELASLPREILDCLIGDAVTEGLKDVAYLTYNGDLDLLKSCIQNAEHDEFVRSALLQAMGQLYLDGNLAEQEWRDFIVQRIHDGREYDYLYDELVYVICSCHFVDMLPEIRYLFENDLVDESVHGKYDSCVDMMFEYNERDENFCVRSMDAAVKLRSWAMFQEEECEFDQEKKIREFERLMREQMVQVHRRTKIQRNDPCPCGSGKKYKQCCLNKPKEPIDLIEDEFERQKWLRDYPPTAVERQEGRVYLEDYYDAESIEIDRLLYLGLMHRPGLVWERDEKREKERAGQYLKLAFAKLLDKTEREQIKNAHQYDEKYSIHYTYQDWAPKLMRYLKEQGKSEARSMVADFCRD